MSLILGSGSSGQKAKPQYTGLSMQTSTSIVAVTQGWGLNRAAGNILWQSDFQSHKQEQNTGKGGGGSTSVSYTYSGSFILGLGWGTATGCRMVWKDQSKTTDYTSLGFTLIPGTIPQSPWGYIVTSHPTEALGYPGTVLMCVSNYDLGQSNTLPIHSFEIEWPLLNTAPGATGDADVALVISDFLTNTSNGALTGPSLLLENLLSSGAAPAPGDACAQTYWKALNLSFSPLLDSQDTALSILDRWTTIFNTRLCWTGYSIKFIPYSADTITGNGVTYLPDTTIKFALGDSDFIRPDGDDPVKMSRVSPGDTYNSFKLEIKNRHNEYNNEPAEWRDQGLVDQFGLRAADSLSATEICEPTIGAACVALYGQRQAYVRNQFIGTVGPEYMLVQPGDIGTVNDPRWGTINVCVVDTDEQDDGSIQLMFEEYNGSVGSSGGGSSQGITNNPVNTAVVPNAVNTPIIFEPPSTLAGPTAQVWIAVSG